VPGPIINWDDVRGRSVQESGIDAVFFNFGASAGSVQVGLRRERIGAGRRGLPPHVHLAEQRARRDVSRRATSLLGRRDVSRGCRR